MSEIEYNRLKWQCRRGMLELDVILNEYLERVWTSMDDEEMQTFYKLLKYTDQQLQGWLCDGKAPDKEVAAIVRSIRASDNY